MSSPRPGDLRRGTESKALLRTLQHAVQSQVGLGLSMRQKMSKRHRSSGISLLLSAMRDWSKRTATRCWQGVSGIVGPIRSGRRNSPFEGVRRVNVEQSLRKNLCGQWIELNEVSKILRIGDRIRVLCDDGVLVAEKVSQTEFRLIDSQRMSTLVH